MSSIVMDRYRYCPPLSSQFTDIVGTNSENPTVTDTTGRGLNLKFGSSPNGSGENIRGCFKSLNAAASQTIIARFDFFEFGWEYSSAGLLFTDGTKFVGFLKSWRGVPGYSVDYFTNSTTFSSEPYVTGQNTTGTSLGAGSANTSTGSMEWMRVDLVSSVPQIYYVSSNGTDWIELYNSTSSGFMSAPTKVGFGWDTNVAGSGAKPVTSTLQSYLNVLYYSDPDITPPV